MSAQLSVSHYHDNQELSYQVFDVTAAGLAAARELLATATANRFRYGLSPWQFESPYGGAMSRANQMLEAGDVAGLRQLLGEEAPVA